MEFFLVGGCIRDMLLGIEPKDFDFVVVGATEEWMISHGYEKVGSDFPVFLHPVTKEEVALARTERKTGKGYHGFTVDSSSVVTIEEDLMRRDISMNAIARRVHLFDNGAFEVNSDEYIDPYNGQEDLKNGIIRHVSDAFADDPVRVLRVARFVARYGFAVADETIELMRKIVNDGETDTLTAERVWLELDKVLGEKEPWKFFEVLRECGALKSIFPELDALYGIPQPAQWHPEIDTGVHTMMVLEQACKLSDDKATRFAALVHDLGKAITPKDKLPSHPGHEEDGVPLVNAMCDRLKVPTEFRKLAVGVCRYHLHVHKATELRAGTMLEVYEGIDARRSPAILKRFLDAVEADARGRKGLEDREYPQRKLFEAGYDAMNSVSAAQFVDRGFKGSHLGNMIRQERIMQIKRVVNQLKKDMNLN